MRKRILKINELIKTIAGENDSFFKNKSNDKIIANFKLKGNKLFYQDEFTGTTKEIKNKTTWQELINWVNHGSGIRNQIIDFAQYIFTGEPKKGMLSRYWGISIESQIKIHKKAHELGYLDGDKGFSFYDYNKKEDRYVCDKCGEVEAFCKCEKGMYLCGMCRVIHYHLTGHRTEDI